VRPSPEVVAVDDDGGKERTPHVVTVEPVGVEAVVVERRGNLLQAIRDLPIEVSETEGQKRTCKVA
jgi:hypothetical protein